MVESLTSVSVFVAFKGIFVTRIDVLSLQEVNDYITKTYLYNFDPLKPHLYIEKLGFTGVYIIFLISAQKHISWALCEAVLTITHSLYFEQKYEKYQNSYKKTFSFLMVKFSIYLNRRVFVMNIMWRPSHVAPNFIRVYVMVIRQQCGFLEVCTKNRR